MCGRSYREQVRENVELVLEYILALDGFGRDEPDGRWWTRELRLMASTILEAVRHIARMCEYVELIENCAWVLGGVWANKGQTMKRLIRTGGLNGAITAYREWVAMDPKYADAQFRLDRLLMRSRR